LPPPGAAEFVICDHTIELFFGKLKENRRLAVRYEKLDVTFLGFITIAIVAAFYL
jgi:transposase